MRSIRRLKIWRSADGELAIPQDLDDDESKRQLEYFAYLPVEVVDSLLENVGSVGLISTLVSISSLEQTDPAYLRGHLARVHGIVSEEIPLLECEAMHLMLHS